MSVLLLEAVHGTTNDCGRCMTTREDDEQSFTGNTFLREQTIPCILYLTLKRLDGFAVDVELVIVDRGWVQII